MLLTRSNVTLGRMKHRQIHFRWRVIRFRGPYPSVTMGPWIAKSPEAQPTFPVVSVARGASDAADSNGATGKRGLPRVGSDLESAHNSILP